MPIIIFMLTLFSICILVVVLLIRKRQKRVVSQNVVSGSSMEAKKILILKHLRKSNGAIPKVSIIEGLEIPPRTFKAVISLLRADRLITETPTHINITMFGRQYYDIFVKKNKD